MIIYYFSIIIINCTYRKLLISTDSNYSHPQMTISLSFSVLRGAAPGVVNRGKKNLVGRQTSTDEEKKREKKWRIKKGSKTREEERVGVAHTSNALCGVRQTRLLRPTHFPCRCTYPRALPSFFPRPLHPTDDDPPRPCACPPILFPFYSLSSPPRHERPSLTYEWRRLVSGNSRHKAIRRASIVCPDVRLSRLPVPLSLDSRPSRERERATMILRHVGVFFDEFSWQHVIKTLSARWPSRPSAIFSSWNYARL